MHNDDRQIGRLLTRREALLALGATGAAGLLRCSPSTSTPAPARRRGSGGVCIARPEQTEGPYFVDERLNRSDIRSDPATGEVRPGVPLDLTFRVSRITDGECAPRKGTLVDVWQCDHLGVYSDVEDPAFDTTGRKFLRGYQVTDREGIARFITIFPGWYRGRAVHIHFKIRSEPEATPGFDFTSQLYFDDEFTDEIHALEPYAEKGSRDRRNASDRIYSNGGSQLTLQPIRTGSRLAALFDVALELT